MPATRIDVSLAMARDGRALGRAATAAAATEEDLDLDREIEYAFDADEPLGGTRGPVGDVE
jgi:hypothetical protein